MNKFVNYLNSLNNASGNNENAIAENQLSGTDQFYKYVTVKRTITENITQDVLGDTAIVYFLTGHAGDGKTSILLQVIENLISDMSNFEFKEFDDISIKDGRKFHYVKDISELPKEVQLNQFQRAIDLAQTNNTSSVVISNTGQLLELFKNNGYEESIALGFIDCNEGKEVKIANVRVKVINIALCDNTDFIAEFIDKIICDELWKECKSCKYSQNCPTYLNAKLVKNYREKVSTFIENYYKWNSANNNRATIRQMIAHISYAITGNVNCNGIHRRPNLQLKDFDNNFANLFFGYKYTKKGLVVDNSARNIKGIRDIQKFRLDSKKMNIEYDIFVKENFNAFPDELKPYVNRLWKEYKISDQTNDLSKINAIKRVYMMFNILNESDTKIMYKELYSNMFPYYVDLQNNKGSNHELKKIKNIIFNGVFKLFTGFPADSAEQKLYLTLKQNGEKTQNVQVVQGYIYRDEFEVQTEPRLNIATGEKYKIISIKMGDSKAIPLSYRMLEFLDQVNRGIVQTQIDPMLSQGIDNIKVAFRKVMKTGSKGELTLLVYTGVNVKTKRICIEDGYIEVL